MRTFVIAGSVAVALVGTARLTADAKAVDVGANLRPPIPRVSSLGVTRRATLVSYCWSETFPGGGRGVCADGTPGDPAQTLRWRPGARIRVDLRLPAHDVRIQAVRFPGGIGTRPIHIVRLKIVRVDQAGRRWTLHLSRRATRDTDLLIFATFANGDIAGDLGIRRR